MSVLHQNYCGEGRALGYVSCVRLSDRPHLSQEAVQLKFQHHEAFPKFLFKIKNKNKKKTSSGLREAGRSPPVACWEGEQCG